MNKDNIHTLADFIESDEYVFDMNESHADVSCGTAGCIGAHAAVIWPDIRYSSDTERRPGLFTWNDKLLMRKLGIDHDTHQLLCYAPRQPSGEFLSMHQVTRGMAVAALRHLADTGEVMFVMPEGTSDDGND